jgi:hypothetical protein
MIRKNETFRKYTAQEMEEYNASQNELYSRIAEDDAESAKRGQMVMKGLVEKYGFSESGAKATLALIQQGVDMMGRSHLESAIKSGRFGADTAKQQAARNAFQYFWK